MLTSRPLSRISGYSFAVQCFQSAGYWQTEPVSLEIYALVGACNAGRNRIADRHRIIF